MWIRDPRWKKFGSGMEKSRIRDKHHGSGINITDPQHWIQDTNQPCYCKLAQCVPPPPRGSAKQSCGYGFSILGQCGSGSAVLNPGFWWKKSQKHLQIKNNIFLDHAINPWASIKNVQATGEASALQSHPVHTSIQYMEIIPFFYFC